MMAWRAHRVPRAAGAAGLLTMVGDYREAMVLVAEERHAKEAAAIVQRFLWSGRINDPADLTSEAVTRYLADLARHGRSPKTLLNHRSAISSFCESLCRQGLLSENPCRRVRLKVPERRPPRWLTDEELATVLRIARARGIWPEVMLAVSTGLRLGELIRLRWADVELERRRLLVRKSKSRRPRMVWLSSSAVAALTEQRPLTGHLGPVFPARRTWRGGWRFVEGPRHCNWWRRALRPIQDAVPKFRQLPGSSTGRGWHLFRHTHAARAAQAGVSLQRIGRWLGHADVRTTEIYAHLAPGFDEQIEQTALELDT